MEAQRQVLESGGCGSRAWAGAAALALLALAACTVPSPNAPAADADADHRLFADAYEDIGEYYINPTNAGTLALAGLRKLSTIDGALSIERDGDEVVLRRGSDERRFAVPDTRDAADWGALTEVVLDAARGLSPAVAGIPHDRLDEIVMDGTLATLDRFSRYARPELARERRAVRDGFGGIGVSLDTLDTGARIVSVLPHTPAAAAGLRADDRIVSLNGVATTGLSAEEVRNLLRGPIDSRVVLDIAREGAAEPITISVKRAYITERTVTLQHDDSIADIRISSFNQQTARNVIDSLRKAHRDMGDALRGIVLDLRSNPGGLLDQSVEVASLFLDGTTVVSTVGRNPQSFQLFTAPARRGTERLPVVVLVNGGSASASEIVAAALQDSSRAVVIGTSSYGKGTVQTVLRMPNDGELTVTWARLVAPRGYLLHRHGVVPTVCTVDLTDGDGDAAAALQRTASALPKELARPRSQLDENGWRRLRQLCPALSIDRDVDLRVARALLDDPALYGRALQVVPSSLARNVEGDGGEP